MPLCSDDPSSHSAGMCGRLGKRMRCDSEPPGQVRRLEVADQLRELFGKIIRHRWPRWQVQREGGRGIGSRGSANLQVDAIRVHAAEHAERLGNLQRAVVRQHNPAAANAQAQDVAIAICPISTSGLRASQCRRAVVLGDPVAVVAQPIG